MFSNSDQILDNYFGVSSDALLSCLITSVCLDARGCFPAEEHRTGSDLERSAVIGLTGGGLRDRQLH